MTPTKSLAFVCLAAAMGLACAPRTRDDPHDYATITSATLPAPPAADAELSRDVAAGSSDPILSAATSAVIRGDDVRVLELTDSDAMAGTPPEQRSPWLDYDRAIALARIGRTDDARAAYENAAKRFESRGQGRQRAMAVYGEAQMLSNAHRCREAGREYQRYAGLVRPTDPADAKMALMYAAECHGAPAGLAHDDGASR